MSQLRLSVAIFYYLSFHDQTNGRDRSDAGQVSGV